MDKSTIKISKTEQKPTRTIPAEPVKFIHFTDDEIKKIEEQIINTPITISPEPEIHSGFVFPIRFQFNCPHYNTDFLSRTYNWTRVPQKGETVYFRSANTAYDVVEVCAIVDNDGCIESYRVTLS